MRDPHRGGARCHVLDGDLRVQHPRVQYQFADPAIVQRTVNESVAVLEYFAQSPTP